MQSFNLDIKDVDAGILRIGPLTYTYTGAEYVLRKGKFCLFAGNAIEKVGMKMFMHPVSRGLRKHTRYRSSLGYDKEIVFFSMEQVQLIFDIHKKLLSYGVVPKLYDLITCQVRGKTGYGIRMEYLPESKKRPNRRKWRKYLRRLMEAGTKYEITRRGTLQMIMSEASSPANYRITAKGKIRLIDIDPLWRVGKSADLRN